MGRPDPAADGWHLTQMFDGMERGELRALYVIGENPAQSEADIHRARRLLDGARLPGRPGHRHDEDGRDGRRRLPAPARPGASRRGRSRTPSAACSACARRSTRPARRATTCGSSPSSPAGSATTGAADRRRGLGRAALAQPDARRHELPAARGARRHPVAVPRRGAPRAPSSCTAASGRSRAAAPRRRSASSSTGRRSRRSTTSIPIRLTTGRRLESYNTGVQSGLYRSPLHRGETIDLSPEDAERLLLEDGEIVRVSSRRGSVEAPVRIDPLAAAGARVHDAALPGRGRHQRAHDRRDRSEVRHGRVQGGRDPRREDRRRSPVGGDRRGSRSPRLRSERGGLGSTGGPPSPRGQADRGRARRRRHAARAGRRPAGTAASGASAVDGHVARGGHDARAAARPAAARAPRRPGARRLDQPRRAQLRLRAPDGPARRRLRRRDLLRALLARAAPAARRSTSATTSPAGAAAPTS